MRPAYAHTVGELLDGCQHGGTCDWPDPDPSIHPFGDVVNPTPSSASVHGAPSAASSVPVDGPGRVPGCGRTIKGAATGRGVLTLTLTGRRFSANDRHHWRAERALKQEWRELGQVHARAAIGPSARPLERVHVTVTQVPGSRRKTDPGNVAPAAKAAIDGIVLAGALIDDDSAHLVGPDYRLADVPVRQAPGMWTLRITVTPLDPATGRAA